MTWPNMSPGTYVVVIEGWGYSEGEYALAFGCPPGGTDATVPSTTESVRSTADRDSTQTEDGTVTSVAVTVVRMLSHAATVPYLARNWRSYPNATHYQHLMRHLHLSGYALCGIAG